MIGRISKTKGIKSRLSSLNNHQKKKTKRRLSIVVAKKRKRKRVVLKSIRKMKLKKRNIGRNKKGTIMMNSQKIHNKLRKEIKGK